MATSNVVKLPDGSFASVTPDNKGSIFDIFLKSGRYDDPYHQKALADALNVASSGSAPQNTDFFSWWTVLKNTVVGSAKQIGAIPGAVIKPAIDTTKWVSIGLLAVAVITLTITLRKK